MVDVYTSDAGSGGGARDRVDSFPCCAMRMDDCCRAWLALSERAWLAFLTSACRLVLAPMLSLPDAAREHKAVRKQIIIPFIRSTARELNSIGLNGSVDDFPSELLEEGGACGASRRARRGFLE